MTEPPAQEQDAALEPPPVLGTWRRAYALVVLEFLALVVLLYALARWAA